MTIAQPLPPEVVSARDGLLAFSEQEIKARHRQHEELLDDPRRRYQADGSLSPDVRELIRQVRSSSADAGFYQMCVPEELGGGGLGHLAYYVAWEALFHDCGPQNWLMLYALAHWAFGPSRLLEQMTATARDKYLAGLMDGSASMCFALSEPNAGSDASMISTRAQKDGDGWRINGRKIWTSNAPIADYCILFAVTDAAAAAAKKGGISAFMVPTDTAGFTMERVIKLFGHIGGDEAELSFEDLYVEPWQLIGELHQGFATALYGVSLGRIYNSARAVGYGRWGLEKSLEYTKIREAFGQTISAYQGVTFPLAECATELHAAHLMGINAGQLLDQGHPAVKELSMTKAYSVQIGLKAVDRAIQTHGAMGFTNELGLTEAWHALRIVNVADGTNEILYRTISQRLLKGDVQI
ncbi:MAG: acyl-CoA dehydrogenase family protein [Pseudomonadales bacterium]|jgi:acyl-CoA dehydrogenase|nr:acyl-CoA dehydrogenase family protein [Pseudomonadales bacterium]MDP7145651.1 acyl-CoA dehydrogenase family protein [Pseudomonadales bacterium]HJN50750.1 acyl-CoA dehydrogenase family protein [Pseudomonadales bacterium]|tara:strand:+ start:836 stop:2068 length:1233 start_codon:yes stop_codon:yes gene_type:complete